MEPAARTQGAAGATGSDGTDGTDGTDGSALRATATFSGSLNTPDEPATTPVTLTGNQWTQKAGELNVLIGRATYAVPASCAENNMGYMQLNLSVTNTFNEPGPFFAPFNTQDQGQERTNTYNNVYVLPAPAVDTPHEITATVTDNCTGTAYALKDVLLQLFAVG